MAGEELVCVLSEIRYRMCADTAVEYLLAS